jgi:hypothetical protein
VYFFRFCLVALTLAAFVTPLGAAEPIAFLGNVPGDVKIRAQLSGDIRQFKTGERDALIAVVLKCELDRSNLARRSLYDMWEKGCKRAEGIWNGKYQRAKGLRMIDIQMRHYAAQRVSLIEATKVYFTHKETIVQKSRNHEDIATEVKAAIGQRKVLYGKISRMLKFFFTLKEVMAASRN